MGALDNTLKECLGTAHLALRKSVRVLHAPESLKHAALGSSTSIAVSIGQKTLITEGQITVVLDAIEYKTGYKRVSLRRSKQISRSSSSASRFAHLRTMSPTSAWAVYLFSYAMEKT